jgi:uncharacterized protein (DUF433 family)
LWVQAAFENLRETRLHKGKCKEGVTMLTALDWSGCAIIERDPEKLHGAPTVRGVRITPDAIVDNFNDGLSVAEILEQFGGITEQDVKMVLSYAAEQGFLARSPG